MNNYFTNHTNYHLWESKNHTQTQSELVHEQNQHAIATCTAYIIIGCLTQLNICAFYKREPFLVQSVSFLYHYLFLKSLQCS